MLIAQKIMIQAHGMSYAHNMSYAHTMSYAHAMSYAHSMSYDHTMSYALEGSLLILLAPLYERCSSCSSGL